MDHREASLLLVDYVKGGVNADQRRAVSEHVAAHPECAETVRFLEQLDADLQRHRGRLLDDHPAADALVAYAVGASAELEAVERASIAAHVGQCAACFGDLQTVRRVHAELVESPESATVGGGRRRGGWVTLGAALAAGLLLGVMAQRVMSPPSASEGWSGAMPFVRVVGNLRDGAVPSFTVPKGAPVVPFTAAWDPWQLAGATAATPLAVRLEDASGGKVFWKLATTIGEAWDAGAGALSFMVPTSAVTAGECQLVIVAPDGTEAFTSRLSLILR
jgi:anti-sigma factor RsiW